MVSGTLIAKKEFVDGRTLKEYLEQSYPRKMNTYHCVAVQFMEVRKTGSYYWQIIERHRLFGSWQNYNGVRYEFKDEAMKVFNNITN